METQHKASAECQLNKSDNNLTQVCHESGILYFRPETEEIIVVPAEEAGDFEAHCLDLLGHVDEYHQANHAYSAAIEQYGQHRQQPAVNTDHQAAEVVAAENRLEKKRAALLDKLKDGETRNMGYQSVVELLPLLDTRKRGSGNQRLGRRYVYANQRYFSERAGGRAQAGAKKKWHQVTLKNKETATGKDSIYVVDSKGRRRFDTKKLKEQLTHEILPVLKLALKDYVDLDDYNLDTTLFDWAQSWNDSLGSHPFDNGIEIAGTAQFMRFVSNVGAQAEFNPNQGHFTIKGETKASLAIAAGIGSAKVFIPDRLGWDLRFIPGAESAANKSEQVLAGLNMGVIRICLENQLMGFVGASAQLEAQLQVMVKDDEQQVVAGQPQGQLPRFHQRQGSTGRSFYKQMKQADEGVAFSAQAFAGASAEFALKGALQWLQPTPPATKYANLSKSAGEFTDIASIGTSIAGLTGIGAGASFACEFINGKFCFKVAASLCCGLGAKGAFICEVENFQEFGRWLAYQLFALNYRFFDLVVREAFATFTQLCVLQMADFTQNIYQLQNTIKSNIEAVASEFKDFVMHLMDENQKNIAASQRRNQLAKNILAHPAQLLFYTPEAKGILLYLLTRHGVWDHLDLNNRGRLLLDIYSDRKEAVIQVLRSIQTQREWRKVMCHRNRDGTNLAQDGEEQPVVQQQEQQLRDFLQQGVNRDQEMARKAAELTLTTIHARLKAEHELSWGYALAMNDTSSYRLNRAPNPHFPQRCTFGPCDAAITQLT